MSVVILGASAGCQSGRPVPRHRHPVVAAIDPLPGWFSGIRSYAGGDVPCPRFRCIFGIECPRYLIVARAGRGARTGTPEPGRNSQALSNSADRLVLGRPLPTRAARSGRLLTGWLAIATGLGLARTFSWPQSDRERSTMESADAGQTQRRRVIRYKRPVSCLPMNPASTSPSISAPSLLAECEMCWAKRMQEDSAEQRVLEVTWNVSVAGVE